MGRVFRDTLRARVPRTVVPTGERTPPVDPAWLSLRQLVEPPAKIRRSRYKSRTTPSTVLQPAIRVTPPLDDGGRSEATFWDVLNLSHLPGRSRRGCPVTRGI